MRFSGRYAKPMRACDALVLAEVGMWPMVPHSLEAEQAVLGSMLLDAHAIDTAAAALRPEDYYRDAHKLVHVAAVAMRRAGTPVDLTTLGAELERRGQLRAAGGRPYLATLLDAVPTAGHAEYYAREVRALAVQRALLAVGHGIVEAMSGAVEDIERAASDAEKAVREVARRTGDGKAPRTLHDTLLELDVVFAERDRQPRAVTGLQSGLRTLDLRTNGFHPGAVCLVSAPPGGGKSAFVEQVALRAAAMGKRVHIASMEMTARQLGVRAIANLAGVDSLCLERGTLTAEERARRLTAMGRLAELPAFSTDDAPGQTVAHILATARRLQAAEGLDLLVVDHFHLIRPRQQGTETETEAERAVDLKDLAMDLAIPVLVPCQVRKMPADLRGKERNLDDVIGSRAITANAHQVIILYEPPLAEGVDRSEPHNVFAEISKNRFGPTGRVLLRWEPRFTRFTDLTTQSGGGEGS